MTFTVGCTTDYRYTIEGAHTDKTYSYKVGVCVDADSTSPGCAVLQTDSANHTDHSYCVGKTMQAQVARSELTLSLSLRTSLTHLPLPGPQLRTVRG